ncbi:Heterokaryon incompatibility 6, OR allele [Fusarium agapanthi]|uniref:Heterokaryon incompatibility 6, OR allele n=1 Tax=Fusarium agapanthi TaxID=1803897 RepID=A0A9P5B0F8_9HYPO|nr:Heterokaryon incompatibility 6, OR allele [Fusarium agapanthi]
MNSHVVFLRSRQLLTGTSHNRARLLQQLHHNLSKQWHSIQTSSQWRSKTKRSRLTWRDIIWISAGALGWGQVFISLVYQPLRDNSVLTNIAQSTVFRIIPAKLAQPVEREGNGVYQPITGDKEIRLLILEPGAREDPLECQLVNAELSWRTRFEALSYAWGDGTIKYQLKCSGHDICVRANLHDALLDLRHPTRKRVLWIDALCINQADNDEKSNQIRLMHEIYSQAQEVLIYLGKSDPSVRDAVRSMRCLDLMRLARSNRHPRIYILGQWWYRPLLTGHPMDGQGGSKLFDLILMSRRYKCTHPHDKIFGMLGVTGEDTSSELLKPDYNISPMGAYQNFVLWEIYNNGSFRVLGVSSQKTSQHRSSPSWVPNFSNLDPIEGLTGALFSVAGNDASAGLPIEIRESSDETTLQIKGSIVDKVHTVGKKSFTERSTRSSKHDQRDERISVNDQLRVNREMVEEARDIWLEATKGAARGVGPGPEDHIFDTTMNQGSRSSMVVKEISTSFLRLTLAEDKVPKEYAKGEKVFAMKGLSFFAAIAQSRRFARTDMGLSSNATIGSSEQALTHLTVSYFRNLEQ